jgi:hypothetical protein
MILSLSVAHLSWCTTEIILSVAHGQVRHKILILWREFCGAPTHAPHNMVLGAPQMSFFLLVTRPAIGDPMKDITHDCSLL